MSTALALIAALLVPEPDCGVVGLEHIDRAAYQVVNGMADSVGSDGRVSLDYFAPSLAAALQADRDRAARGETPRLRSDWLTDGGAMSAVADRSLYSLNRSGVDDIVMLLGFTNAQGERVHRRLSLGCYEGRWRIRSIFLGDEEGFLTDLLAGKP